MPKVKKKKKSVHESKPKVDLELDADAWPKFEQMIRSVAKAGPQHRVAQQPTKARKTKKRAATT